MCENSPAACSSMLVATRLSDKPLQRFDRAHSDIEPELYDTHTAMSRDLAMLVTLEIEGICHPWTGTASEEPRK